MQVQGDFGEPVYRAFLFIVCQKDRYIYGLSRHNAPSLRVSLLRVGWADCDASRPFCAQHLPRIQPTLSGASSKRKLFKNKYYETLVSKCRKLEDEHNNVHGTAQNEEEVGADVPVRAGRSKVGSQEEEAVTDSVQRLEHGVPASSGRPALRPKAHNLAIDSHACGVSESSVSQPHETGTPTSCLGGPDPRPWSASRLCCEQSNMASTRAGTTLNSVKLHTNEGGPSLDDALPDLDVSTDVVELSASKSGVDLSLKGSNSNEHDDGEAPIRPMSLSEEPSTSSESEVRAVLFPSQTTAALRLKALFDIFLLIIQ